MHGQKTVRRPLGSSSPKEMDDHRFNDPAKPGTGCYDRKGNKDAACRRDRDPYVKVVGCDLTDGADEAESEGSACQVEERAPVKEKQGGSC